MITEQEREQISLLSDTELYTQAVEFMRRIGKTLPLAQINGLLNVTLNNTYEQLETFVKGQHRRTTWPRDAQHVPDFYFRLARKLKSIEEYIPSLVQHRQEQLSQEDEQTLKGLLAREFMQHLLAENAYMSVRRTPNTQHQGKSQGSNRGPSTR